MTTRNTTLRRTFRLVRKLFDDQPTARLFLALVAIDLLFIGLVGAKALALIEFSSGLGAVMIASQLTLATLVLGIAWWLRRGAALGSLVLIAIALAALKLSHLHKLVSVHVATALDARGLEHSTAMLVGLFVVAMLLASLAFVVLAVGWLRSDRQGRAAILVVGAGFIAMAAAAVSADIASSLLEIFSTIDRFSLARLEQGVEIIAVSALLALVVGVVRIGWAPDVAPRSRTQTRVDAATPP
jgi:hypothetical protein